MTSTTIRTRSETGIVLEDGEEEGKEEETEIEGVKDDDGFGDVVEETEVKGVGEDEAEIDPDAEGEARVAVTKPLTSLWAIGSEVSSGCGWSANVLTKVKDD